MLVFDSVFATALVVIISCGVLSLLTAGIFRTLIVSKSAGTEAMQNIARQVRVGAMAFLKREYVVISTFSIAVAILLYLFLDTGFEAIARNDWAKPYTAVSFLVGAFCSVLAGFIGMGTATEANVRTANAARKNLGDALRIAFLSGATMGLSVVGLGLLGLTGLLLYLEVVAGLELATSLEIVTGFSFGASSVALFARVGGGIYTKAADVGADLVGKVEAGIPEDDPRNPAVIADNVGDNVGDVAGMGADLFESYVGSIIAAMIIAQSSATWGNYQTEAVLLPLFLAAFGVIASIIGSFTVRTKKGSKNVHGALKKGIMSASVLFVGAAYVLCQRLPEAKAMPVFYAIIAGLLVGLIIGFITE